MKSFFTKFAVTIPSPCDESVGFLDPDECPSGGNEADVFSLLSNILNWLTIAIGVAAVIFIIISGIQIISSSGNPDKVKKAQRTLLYSIVGLVVAILANVIVRIVFGTAGIF